MSALRRALAIRSDRQSVFTMRPSTNWYIYGAVLICGFLQLIVIYLPPLQGHGEAVMGTNYYWIKDAKTGDTTGQNVGSVWFVAKPGDPARKKVEFGQDFGFTRVDGTTFWASGTASLLPATAGVHVMKPMRPAQSRSSLHSDGHVFNRTQQLPATMSTQNCSTLPEWQTTQCAGP